MRTKEVVVLALVVFNVLMLFGLFFGERLDVSLSPSFFDRKPSIQDPVYMDPFVYHSCLDTDYNDIYNKGRVFGSRHSRLSQYYPPTIENYEFWDVCVGTSSVKEWLCSVSRPISVENNCPIGFECFDGACVSLGPVCGDGIVEGEEVCDGADLGGESCVSQGYDSGVLNCLPDCTGFDYSGCEVDNPVNSCVVIDSPGVYKMTSSIVNNGPSIENHCISIRADDVTLNCLNHEIKNDYLEMIGIYSDSENTIVENCRVSMTFYDDTYPRSGSKGIVFDGAVDSILRNNYLWENPIYGIEMVNSQGTEVVNNFLTMNNPGKYSEGEAINVRSNSNNVVLRGNTVERSRKGMNVNSQNVLVENNTIRYNSEYGLRIFGNGNLVVDNLVHSNNQAFSMDKNAIFDSNTIWRNLKGVSLSHWDDWGQYNFEDNHFAETVSEPFDFDSGARKISVGETAEFSFEVNDPSGDICLSCSYDIELYPLVENLSHSYANGVISGSFVPTQLGLYSVIVEVTDVRGNKQNRKYIYLVNATESLETTYFFRGFEPIHGQPHADTGGRDAGALLFSGPDSYEERRCTSWIQFAPDELPVVPYASYEDLNFSIWYARANQSVGHDCLGFQEYGTFDYSNYDYCTSFGLPPTYAGTQPDQGEKFAFGNYYLPIGGVADYSTSWNWVALKFMGAFPAIKSEPGNISKVEFRYLSTNTPKIVSVDEKIDVLSATSIPGFLHNARIYLIGGGRMVVEMPLDGIYAAWTEWEPCSSQEASCFMTQTGNRELTIDFEYSGTRYVDIGLATLHESEAENSGADRKIDIGVRR